MVKSSLMSCGASTWPRCLHDGPVFQTVSSLATEAGRRFWTASISRSLQAQRLPWLGRRAEGNSTARLVHHGLRWRVMPDVHSKSTVLRLIYPLYDVQAGRITVDGQDIRSVKLDSLRKHIAVVPQVPLAASRRLACFC